MFNKAREIDAAEAFPYYNAGLIHMLEGQGPKALPLFEKAVQLAPNLYEALFQISRIHSENKAFEQAITTVQKAIVERPQAAAAHRLLGDCLAASGQSTEAVASYEKAIKLNPDDAEALSALGHLYDLRNENPEIATVYCQQSVALQPQNGLFRYRLGRLYQKEGHLAAAQEAFAKALALGYDAAEALAAVQNDQPVHEASQE
jgi:tetratricopeptide (TPR) repeat protein